MDEKSKAEVYSEDAVFPFYLSNFTGDIKTSALLDIMLLASENQLKQADADSVSMVERGLGWVVTQYHLDIKTMPKVGQPLKVSTRATSYNKFFYYRDFWIDDVDGNRMVTLESAFVIIDIKKRKIVSASDSLGSMFGSEETNSIKRFARLREPKEFDNQRFQHIGYYNIDVNRHVNNTYYFDWMVDSLDIEFIATHRIKTMDIKYEKELNTQSKPEIYSKMDGLTSTHWIKNGDQLNVVAKFTWVEK
ncbi:acyl-[acyl-carrier-protein] thioesterase [Companilactobacillus sp.]|jgi:medium-chain acyl-[acyl-carrier-protein] hydrolase|uniref:acyl-[acyl-carrier-protein] thioesterase n=1 Tax=Companilactobacillus sp. TaxID=2767905 RepID=UPI0025BB46AA|nr:acyl-ACP thioesterase domain-containing protein [Companilactobacillus sp.]MCH4010261.1 thioesterase [Companilactobacillus sp.]MCH4052063.1 thioesterase [Companilactobacillus sp.]MCH4078203.1 thioesterase [Companilactobacillus sp.]MCH4126779.1 thioesterase [Companilactobacillus sp.]MCH4132364.1 thioesterase [Companilactobacillus sp.]